jgi:hypothetical protein
MPQVNDANDYFAQITDWRGQQLTSLRKLVKDTSPTLKEDIKWSVPVYTGTKLVLAMSTFKDHVKINFFYGAALPDPHGMFNNGLDSKNHRSIDIAEGQKINQDHLHQMVAAAYAYDLQH